MSQGTTQYRNTTQKLMAASHEDPMPAGHYDVYPVFPVAEDSIDVGYTALAERIAAEKRVVIDGYVGIMWDDFRERLTQALQGLDVQGLQPTWINTASALLPEETINRRIEPFLGGDDPIFGKRYDGRLADFYDMDAMAQLLTESISHEHVIFYGPIAALIDPNAYLIYVDLPKNEIQFRSRAGTIHNLGTSTPQPPRKMYKRFYFVDWIALNHHKREVLPRIDLFVDGQRAEEPTMIVGDTLRESLSRMSQNYFRVRPWFEPGVWGGQWMKQRFSQLPQDPPNYAWSFELIVPENGLVVSDGHHRLEASFDLLMYQENQAVLGECAHQFGYEFPVRFDFLDTYDGGNLSVQCHPRPKFIREHFGETFTQDETYYILDSEPGAEVYLGFQDDIDPAAFRNALETSFKNATELDVKRYVNVELADKHKLFLIPNGTIHCSGQNCLVLEISATPYIFTFKMYDWMRLDLDGKPRPINIERALQNLYFDRKGERIRQEFISHPQVIERDAGWQVVHLPTHADHFYDVHRLEFNDSIDVQTGGSFHVLSLVEGHSILLETQNGMKQRFNYAETFVVPAGAHSYRLINEGEGSAWVIKAFMKL